MGGTGRGNKVKKEASPKVKKEATPNAKEESPKALKVKEEAPSPEKKKASPASKEEAKNPPKSPAAAVKPEGGKKNPFAFMMGKSKGADEVGSSNSLQSYEEAVRKSRYHPVDDACWKRGEKTPYLAFAKTLQVRS